MHSPGYADLIWALGWAALLSISLCFPHVVAAADLETGKAVWSTTAGCIRCHGWAGHGTPELPAFPTGANLRESNLDRSTVREIVRCGIPGTEMPSFRRNAYGASSCYGMTIEDAAKLGLPVVEISLSDAEVEALLDYLLAKVIGQGAVTPAACRDYYGPALPICRY